MGDRIFCQHGNPVGINQFRDTVIDFRVYMVRTSGKDNTAFSGFIKELDNFFTFFADIFLGLHHFLPCGRNSGSDFGFRNIREFLAQTFCENFLIFKRKERIAEINVFRYQFFYIIFNIFGIRRYNRTIIVIVGLINFLMLIRNTRVEDELYTLLNQP